ncbi:MAG: MFS transporter, partial [Victivallaceae bacterium]|nr:MFS transporter [Victivallaceae bacterium]
GLLIIVFPNFTNIFLMPVISYWSDRCRSRWGRRIPFLFATTPLVVIGLAGLGFCKILAAMLQNAVGPEFLSLPMAGLIVFGVFWAILDFGTTLTNAIFVALVNDVVPVCFLGRFFSLFRAVSLGAGILFNFWLLGYAEEYFMFIFLSLAVLYGVGLYSVCLKVREGKYPPPPAATEQSGGAGKYLTGAVKTYFKECFGHSYYAWLMIAFVLSVLASLPVNMYTIFYAKTLGMSMDHLGFYYAMTYAVSLALTYVLGVLADRYHPLRLGIASIGAYFVLMCVSWFTIGGIGSFGILFLLHGIIAGCYMTATASLGQRLFPIARFAQFNSAMWMLMAIANVAAAPLFGKILDLLGNNYKYLFVMGAILAFGGLTCMLKTYRMFLNLGGDRNYVPPEA